MLNASQFTKIDHSEPNINRVDFHATDSIDQYQLGEGFAEYLKTQRLYPDEINEWDKAISKRDKLNPLLQRKVVLALAEGVLKDDLKTIDEDALTGTCGQLIFHWIRAQFYGNEILYRYPELLTDSSKRQGIDYFEIIGNPHDESTLCFVIWEVKATDSDVSTRTNEIYKMHRRRSLRLLRGLGLQISLQYPETTVLGRFARQLL